MADESSRFALPFLQPGQAQKEVFHNEALARIDTLLHATAESVVDDPPSSPTSGQCWIVGTSPTGLWDGQAGALAGWSEGGWLFIPPREGMMLWLADIELWARHDASGWIIGDIPAQSVSVGGLQVIGGQQAPITDPAGGATVDSEARATLTALLVAARAHGLIAT
jgi:hypothetical protein